MRSLLAPLALGLLAAAPAATQEAGPPVDPSRIDPSAVAVPDSGHLLRARIRGGRHAREVDLALAWLAAHQSPSGAWDADGFHERTGWPACDCDGPGSGDADVGVTALALLAFLGDGQTPRHGDHRDAVARGVHWLREQVDPETGRIGPADGPASAYGQALGTLALAEAYRLTWSPLLRETVVRTVGFVSRARNPYGAWRYDVPPTGDNDTSVTAWMVLALDAARWGHLPVDRMAFRGAAMWLEEATDPVTGRVGYDAMGSRSSRVPGANEHFPPERGEAMTAAGLLARMVIDGAVAHRPLLERQVALLRAKPPTRGADGRSGDLVYWFFGAHALAQVGGESWAEWRAALDSALIPAQRTEGHAAGSWDPDGAWGWAGGRVYATALVTLCLQADVRYGSLPHRPASTEPIAQAHGAPEPQAEPERTRPRAGEASPPQRRFLSRRDAPAERSASATAEAFADALDWLVAAQEPQGSWNAEAWPASEREGAQAAHVAAGHYRVGVTGLALLALLSDPAARERRDVRLAIESGAAWLRSQQDPETGEIGDRVTHAQAYNHAIAACALSEALIALGDERLREPTQRAVDFVLRSRNPYGAWRYDVPPIGDNDTSVTGWMVMALTSAQDAGIAIDRAALEGARNWLDEVTDPATGRVGYTSVGSRSSRTVGINEDFPTDRGEALTASGLLARFHLGQVPDTEPILERHAQLLRKLPPEWDPERFDVDMVYWFHGAHAMRLMGGRWWPAWRGALEAEVVPAQRRDGELAGSWDPVGPWGSYGGRVYATALMAMSLESCMR